MYIQFRSLVAITYIAYEGEGRGRIQSVGLCTQYTNEMCAHFCTSPNCSTDSSPETREGSYMYMDVLTYTIPPWVRKLWLHGLAELRNVRDSVALGS